MGRRADLEDDRHALPRQDARERAEDQDQPRPIGEHGHPLAAEWVVVNLTLFFHFTRSRLPFTLAFATDS